MPTRQKKNGQRKVESYAGAAYRRRFPERGDAPPTWDDEDFVQQVHLHMCANKEVDDYHSVLNDFRDDEHKTHLTKAVFKARDDMRYDLGQTRKSGSKHVPLENDVAADTCHSERSMGDFEEELTLAMSQLDSTQRRIIKMSHDGCSRDQITDELRISTATYHRHKANAIRRLRSIMERYDE